MLRILVFILAITASLFGIQNTSMSKLMLQFQGNEFNMMIAPPNLVGVTQKQSKTRKAILEGYGRELKNIKRLVIKNQMQINMKIPNPNMSLIPQYSEIDKQVYAMLDKMVVTLTDVQENILASLKTDKIDSKQEEIKVDTTGENLDIDLESMFDTTGESVVVNNQQLSPEGIFEPVFLDIGELYSNGASVSSVNEVKLPFLMPNYEIERKPVHAIYAMAFFPTKIKGMKVMRMYIHFIVINTETASSTVSVKEVPYFRWDGNYLYISGATSKVIRKILSEVFGSAI